MTVKDGWHLVGGYEVWVEGGGVIRAVVGEGNNRRTAYPYKSNPKGGWIRDNPTVDTLRRGLKSGRYSIQ